MKLVVLRLLGLETPMSTALFPRVLRFTRVTGLLVEVLCELRVMITLSP